MWRQRQLLTTAREPPSSPPPLRTRQSCKFLPFTGRKGSAEATLSVSDALRCFSIRSMVAAPEDAGERDLLRDIWLGRTSNFIHTDYLF